MKNSYQSRHAVLMIIIALTSLCDLSQAAVPTVDGVPPPELLKWEKGLRQAGASRAEISHFVEFLREQSPADLKEVQEYLQGAPPNIFATYLRGVRQETSEWAPKPVFPAAMPARSCEDLRDISIPNATIEIITVDASDGSCRIMVSVTHPPASDHVKVFIALPTKAWNGRFRGTGGSGCLGGSERNLRSPLAQGYATGATDTGHEGDNGSFALNANGRLNWQEIRDNAYLGIHDMTVVGKTLTEAFYGKAPRYSYFVGASTGGRQGLMEAQRYPDDYDGIVAACPSISWHRMVPAAFWAQEVMLRSHNFVPKSKLDAVTVAAVTSCDGLDGVVDGVIDDPNRCRYDPRGLIGTKVGDSIFTEADADVVRKVWEGPRGHDGKFLWYGPSRGADLSALGGSSAPSLIGKPFSVSLEYIQFFLIANPHWDWTSLAPGDFELLFDQSIEEYGAVIGTDDPDLASFRDRGGKIIIYHGLADELVPAQGTVEYYRRVLQRMGGPQQTAQFARLFLLPGVDHALVGAGPSPPGITDAIIDWVENGKAPERIIAELADTNGKTIRTRPLFPYPQVAKYKGRGSTDDARNFVGFTPAKSELGQ